MHGKGNLEKAISLLDHEDKKDFKVTKSEKSFKLLHPVGHDFFKTCRDKLHWSLSKDENSSN